MEEVLHYLELKNQYYEKFHSVTHKFLELTNQNNWDDLTLFVDNRERILNIIRSFDFKIGRRLQEAGLEKDTVEKYQPRVKALFQRRNEWVQKIVALDLELIGKMDDLKSDTIKDLKRSMETTAHLSSFAGPRPKRPAKVTKDA